jgi:hypothetical protein
MEGYKQIPEANNSNSSNPKHGLRHEGVWRSGCIDPHFLGLNTSWRRVANFTPRPLYPWGKSPPYPLDKLGGPQSWSRRHGENSWTYWDSNSDPSVVQPVASRSTDYAIPAPKVTTPWRCMGEWRYSYTILDLGNRLRKVASFHVATAFPSGERSPAGCAP